MSTAARVFLAVMIWLAAGSLQAQTFAPFMAEDVGYPAPIRNEPTPTATPIPDPQPPTPTPTPIITPTATPVPTPTPCLYYAPPGHTTNPDGTGPSDAGACSECPPSAPWLVNGVCRNCPQGMDVSSDGGHCCPAGQDWVNGACRSPIPPQQSCPVYRLHADWLGEMGLPVIFTRTPHTLSCIESEFQRAHDHCAAMGKPPQYMDDCIVGGFFLKSRVGYASSIYSQDVTTSWTVEEAQARSKGGRGVPILDTITDGTFYLNANCQSVGVPPADQLANVCDAGLLQWKTSPISLLLEDDYNIDGDIRFTQFPLEPGKPGAWYTWKASAKAPLLVHDPAKTGKITSASQLFGHWTFGGKSGAALSYNSAATPWANGYEALATLDQNGDGEISGAELAPLALWFDENRDGVSQAGEVRPLSAAQVTKLFYQPNRRDEKTKSIFADVGFEQTAGEQKVIRGSVDWFAAAGKSQHELVSQSLAEGVVCGNSEAAAPALPAADSTDDADLLSGSWSWSAEARSNAQIGETKGFFTFKPGTPGTFSGHSFVELGLERRIGAAQSVVKILALEGTQRVAADGSIRLRFSVKSGKDSRVVNSAILSADGNTLNGTTSITIDQSGKPVKLSYNWTAQKMR